MEGPYTVTVELLDDQLDDIEFKYKKDVKARRLMDHVCETLKLEERDYFGLRYVDKDKRKCWLDLSKTLHKQFKGLSQPRIVNFRVRFYPSQPGKLKEELSRYHLFLQLKKDLNKGRLHCSSEEAARLGAYIIQATDGDFDEAEHTEGYAAEFDLFPTLQDSLRERIEELHKTTLVGVNTSEAESDFMEEACNLMTYGIDPIPVTDIYGTQMNMGFTFRGILLVRNGQLLERMDWVSVRKISHDGKNLIIGTLQGANKGKRVFHFAHSAAAEHAGKLALEQQAFFQNNLSLTLKRSGSFVLRRSSFRFKGTTQKDAQEKSLSLRRDEPRVDRLPPVIRGGRSRSMHDPSIDNMMEEDGSSPQRQPKDSPSSTQNGESPRGDSPGPFQIEMVQVSAKPTLCVNPVADLSHGGDAPVAVSTPKTSPNTSLNPVSEVEEIEFKPSSDAITESLPPNLLEEPITEIKGKYEESSFQPQYAPNHTGQTNDKNTVSDHNHVNSVLPTQKTQEKASSSGLRKAIIILLFVICAIALTMIILFETKSDALKPVRQLKFVKSANQALYKPSRAYIMGAAKHVTQTVQVMMGAKTPKK